MQRYFIQNEDVEGDRVVLQGEQAHHIERVMRMSAGDEFICVDENEKAGKFTITSVQAQKVTAQFSETIETCAELPVHVTIAQADIKGDRFEWMLQKATELGAFGFIGFGGKHSVVKWDEKKQDMKLGRYKKIVQEAAEQSERLRLPAVQHVASAKELLLIADRYDVVWVVSEQSGRGTNHHALYEQLEALHLPVSVLAIFGPEGGFSESEFQLFQDAGLASISLGPRILRAETASTALLSMLGYEYEIKR
ncbi:16S rRNA (uracil(1498)-N(3))-methyltransferase [Geomicrobium sp. JSM 1781026]|uniref:RsmE family RNA methyltransferase n=1 Tax=Geomicrobium sp. JSM 1781026 TaxID=3344580 RepID=UPI0035BFFD3E